MTRETGLARGHASLEAASEEAKAQGKLVFVDVYNPG
jgi:hypothetical protein